MLIVILSKALRDDLLPSTFPCQGQKSVPSTLSIFFHLHQSLLSLPVCGTNGCQGFGFFGRGVLPSGMPKLMISDGEMLRMGFSLLLPHVLVLDGGRLILAFWPTRWYQVIA